MELNFHPNLVDPQAGIPLNRAQRLSNQVLGLMPDFGRTLAQVQQTGDTPSDSGNKKKSEGLMEVSRQFEGLLIHQMLKAMRKTVPKTGLLEGFAGEQYEAMLDEELSKEVVKHQSLGLADNIYDQINRRYPDHGLVK